MLARNCSVCRESCHDHSPKCLGLSHGFHCVVEKNKNVIHQPRSVRIGKNCALCLEYRPSAVSKTSGTVFPNTDRPRLVNDIFVFLQQKQ